MIKQAKKSYERGWEFPGGKVEAGETPEQALAREIREDEIREGSILKYEMFTYEIEEQ